jgi:hypothetical protein
MSISEFTAAIDRFDLSSQTVRQEAIGCIIKALSDIRVEEEEYQRQITLSSTGWEDFFNSGKKINSLNYAIGFLKNYNSFVLKK